MKILFSPTFSSKSSLVLHFTFIPLIRFKLVFVDLCVWFTSTFSSLHICILLQDFEQNNLLFDKVNAKLLIVPDRTHFWGHPLLMLKRQKLLYIQRLLYLKKNYFDFKNKGSVKSSNSQPSKFPSVSSQQENRRIFSDGLNPGSTSYWPRVFLSSNFFPNQE